MVTVAWLNGSQTRARSLSHSTGNDNHIPRRVSTRCSDGSELLCHIHPFRNVHLTRKDGWIQRRTGCCKGALCRRCICDPLVLYLALGSD